MTFNERVGKNIRDLRLEYDMSMRNMAEKLGFTDSKICRIENGGARLHLIDAWRIADLFGVPIDRLIEEVE